MIGDNRLPGPVQTPLLFPPPPPPPLPLVPFPSFFPPPLPFLPLFPLPPPYLDCTRYVDHVHLLSRSASPRANGLRRPPQPRHDFVCFVCLLVSRCPLLGATIAMTAMESLFQEPGMPRDGRAYLFASIGPRNVPSGMPRSSQNDVRNCRAGHYGIRRQQAILNVGVARQWPRSFEKKSALAESCPRARQRF